MRAKEHGYTRVEVVGAPVGTPGHYTTVHVLHIITIVEYFRHAFCLTLAEAKPVAAFSRNEQRQIENESKFDELLLPSILNRRTEWEGREQ